MGEAHSGKMEKTEKIQQTTATHQGTSRTFTMHQAVYKGLPVVKNTPANAGDIRDAGSIPEGGHGNPLQYSCLENPTDRGAFHPYSHRVGHV